MLKFGEHFWSSLIEKITTNFFLYLSLYIIRNGFGIPKVLLHYYFFIRDTYTLKEGHILHLEEMMKKNFGGYYNDPVSRDEAMKVIMNWTIECVSYSNIITLFDIRRYVVRSYSFS